MCVLEGRVAEGSCVREQCGLSVTPCGRPPRDTLLSTGIRSEPEAAYNYQIYSYNSETQEALILWCLEM